MKNKYLEEKIDCLCVDDRFIDLLNGNDIFLVSDLYKLNRKDLKKMGFIDNDINKIIIKLQLIGLDLNGKKY